MMLSGEVTRTELLQLARNRFMRITNTDRKDGFVHAFAWQFFDAPTCSMKQNTRLIKADQWDRLVRFGKKHGVHLVAICRDLQDGCVRD